MNYTFFHILAIDSGRETERLNRFLQKHSIHRLGLQNAYAATCAILCPANENKFRQDKLIALGTVDA